MRTPKIKPEIHPIIRNRILLITAICNYCLRDLVLNMTKILKNKNGAGEGRIERSMLEIKRTDKITNGHIRKQTKLIHIRRTLKRSKM